MAAARVSCHDRQWISGALKVLLFPVPHKIENTNLRGEEKYLDRPTRPPTGTAEPRDPWIKKASKLVCHSYCQQNVYELTKIIICQLLVFEQRHTHTQEDNDNDN